MFVPEAYPCAIRPSPISLCPPFTMNTVTGGAVVAGKSVCLNSPMLNEAFRIGLSVSQCVVTMPSVNRLDCC